MDEDYADDEPVEVYKFGDETLYAMLQADFALATYGQSEPRFANWVFEEGWEPEEN